MLRFAVLCFVSLIVPIYGTTTVLSDLTPSHLSTESIHVSSMPMKPEAPVLAQSTGTAMDAGTMLPAQTARYSSSDVLQTPADSPLSRPVIQSTMTSYAKSSPIFFPGSETESSMMTSQVQQSSTNVVLSMSAGLAATSRVLASTSDDITPVVIPRQSVGQSVSLFSGFQTATPASLAPSLSLVPTPSLAPSPSPLVHQTPSVVLPLSKASSSVPSSKPLSGPHNTSAVIANPLTTIQVPMLTKQLSFTSEVSMVNQSLVTSHTSPSIPKLSTSHSLTDLPRSSAAPTTLASTPPPALEVAVSLRIINEQFDAALENKTSNRFIQLSNQIISEIKKMYNDSVNFVSAEVVNFSEGSVIAQLLLVFRNQVDSPLQALRTAVETGRLGNLSVDPDSVKLVCDPGCHQNATCVTMSSRNMCQCKLEYTGNGTQCSKMNEGNVCDPGCHEHATCEGDRCKCKQNYTGNGIQCSKINEGNVCDPGCHEHATCEGDGCKCKPNYTGNGIQCSKINEGNEVKKDDDNEEIKNLLIACVVIVSIILLIILLLLMCLLFRSCKN